MRVVAFLLLIGGVAAGVIWPWIQMNWMGDPIGELTLYERNSGWQDITIVLSIAENPVRMRFEARTLPDGKLPPINIPIAVRIRDADGPLVAAIINLPAKGRETGPEGGLISGVSSPVFRVQKTGEHVLTAAFAPNPNDGNITKPDLASVKVTFIANAAEPDETHKVPAAVAVLFGVYLLFRTRKRKKRKEKPEDMKWGRGD